MLVRCCLFVDSAMLISIVDDAEGEPISLNTGVIESFFDHDVFIVGFEANSIDV